METNYDQLVNDAENIAFILDCKSKMDKTFTVKSQKMFHYHPKDWIKNVLACFNVDVGVTPTDIPLVWNIEAIGTKEGIEQYLKYEY
jgi:hypothetical protein